MPFHFPTYIHTYIHTHTESELNSDIQEFGRPRPVRAGNLVNASTAFQIVAISKMTIDGIFFMISKPKQQQSADQQTNYSKHQHL